MNAWWVEDEMDYALKDSSPKVLICDEERLHRFEKIRADFPDLKVLTVRCDGQSQDTRPRVLRLPIAAYGEYF